jgi:hypothetical protein
MEADTEKAWELSSAPGRRCKGRAEVEAEVKADPGPYAAPLLLLLPLLGLVVLALCCRWWCCCWAVCGVADFSSGEA